MPTGRHIPTLCRALALAALAAACGKSGQDNAFTPPPITQSAGMPAFKVVKDEMSPDRERVTLRLALAGPTERDSLDALLKDVYRQAMTRLGIEPAVVEIYVYANEKRVSAAPDAFVASCIKRQADKGPNIENKVPLSFPKAVTAALKGDTFVGTLQPKVEIDEAHHHVTLNIPFTEQGQDTWAKELTFNTAMVTFMDYAQRLYQNIPDMDGLSFVGVWKDQPVLRIQLANKEDYNKLDLYALGERIGGKQGKAFAEAQLTHKSDKQIDKEKKAAEKKEYQTALAKLPKAQVTVASSLK
jgi:hypothetical protein